MDLLADENIESEWQFCERLVLRRKQPSGHPMF
jgi:hypothetical protein